MNFTFSAALFCVLLLGVAVQARPQRQHWIFPNQQQQQQITSTSQAPVLSSNVATPAVPTTSSPQFLACMRSCPTTSEYNPVCGNNGESYHNNQRLQCAVFCGQNVAAVRSGNCRS